MVFGGVLWRSLGIEAGFDSGSSQTRWRTLAWKAEEASEQCFGTRGCDGTGKGVEILVAEVQVSQVLCDGSFP